MPTTFTPIDSRLIDHTLLQEPIAPDALARHLTDAAHWRVAAVCIPPSVLPLAGTQRWLLATTGVAVCTVVGFPGGEFTAAAKATEAAAAVAAGADEVDMVISPRLASAADWQAMVVEVTAVRRAIPTTVLKVILESARLSTDQLAVAADAAVAAGADLVKTSTGMHPAGGATVEAVAVLAEVAAGRAGVKASGGIRDAATAAEMITAGATRLGVSATAQVLGHAGAPAVVGY